MELVRRDYFANEGWETFLSYEDPERDIVVGLLRLRKPSDEVFRLVAGEQMSLRRMRRLSLFAGPS